MQRIARHNVYPPGFMSIYAPAAITYLLNAPFTGADQGYANGQVLDTVAEGITAGQLTVVEVDGTVELLNASLSFTAQATPAWSDLGVYSQAVTRTLGRTLVGTVNLAATNTYTFIGFGTSETVDLSGVGVRDKAIQFNNTAGIRFYPNSNNVVYVLVGAYSAATNYQVVIVLGGYDVNGVPWHSGEVAANYLYGASFYIKGGAYAIWTLLWNTSSLNTATLYATFSNYNAVGTLDNFRIPNADLSAVLQPVALSTFSSDGELSAYAPDVGGAWTENIGDWDTATNVLKATALGIATFTGVANSIYDAKITTPASGTTPAGLVVRGADYTGGSEDYWYVKVTPGTAGTDWQLIEYVAGTGTQRAFGDADWVAATAYNIRAICYGQTIDIFNIFANEADKLTYASAASGETATGFGLRDEGNANMTFDNVALFNRTSVAQFDNVFDLY